MINIEFLPEINQNFSPKNLVRIPVEDMDGKKQLEYLHLNLTSIEHPMEDSLNERSVKLNFDMTPYSCHEWYKQKDFDSYL